MINSKFYLVLSFFSFLILNNSFASENFLEDPQFPTYEERILGLPSTQTIIEKIINFDVVVNNPHYRIYRSSMLGKYGLGLLSYHLKSKNLPFPKTIIYMNKVGYNGLLPPGIGNFAVEEFQNQKAYGYKFYHSFDYKYRTYLDGHNPYHPNDDIDSEPYLLGATARELFGVIEDHQKDGGVDSFLRILNIILDKENSPVLFHCFGGRHRTGLVALAIRYSQGGDWIDGPKKEIYIGSIKRNLALNPAQYEYYVHNPEMFRLENLEFIEEFSHDPRFLELLDKYGHDLTALNELEESLI